MRLRWDCQPRFQPRDQVSSIPIVSCSFPVISYHFLFKNKQTRKTKREVRQLIKSRVSPGNPTSFPGLRVGENPGNEVAGNQTSNLLKRIKEGRALKDWLISRLVLLPFQEPRPHPPPPHSPNPHQAARVVNK